MGKTWKDKQKGFRQWKRHACFACGRPAKKMIDKLFCSVSCKKNVLRDSTSDCNLAVIRRMGLKPVRPASTNVTINVNYK